MARSSAKKPKTPKKPKKLKLGDLEGQADPKAPLDWQTFLSAAQPVLKLLQEDLRARAKTSPSVGEVLKNRHADEKAQRRTAATFIDWQNQFIAQVSAAWMLSCVFLRTLEDRGLLGHNRLAGPGAADSLKLFLELAPSLNERDYLLTVFRELTRFPSTKGLFDARHNPVWLLAPSAEGAKALVQLFRHPHAEIPAFRFGHGDTGFLGWLYQDLDASVRKRFALLQTPRFIESFILDRTLEPAIETFGLDDTTIIDPTCGSGHFLLGAFQRLVNHRLLKESGLNPRDAAGRALDAVYGADLNPYAVAIARFRLTLAFFDVAGFTRLADAPVPPLHVVVADSLLHNPHVDSPELADRIADSATVWRGQAFALEDEAAAREVMRGRYAAVVGNPPYIRVKDAELRERYRALYPRSAAGKYSIAAPFTQCFFQIARANGRVGMITATSFMKREFGKKLIEQYLPTVNLDLVINTSGAFIPGHGTPTVLLFGAAAPAVGRDVQTVLANRGEPSIPSNPEQGLVWRSIAEHWSEPAFENEFISVAKTARDSLAKHPWSLGGGGAAELKATLEEDAERTLDDVTASIGIGAVTGEDDAYVLPVDAAQRLKVGRTRLLVTGESVRDWSIAPAGACVFPVSSSLEVLPPSEAQDELRYLWPYKAILARRKRFGTPMLERGLTWYELQELYANKLRTPLTITFAEVATHNHFALDRGGKVFKNTAPIIKLPASATENDHLGLLAYLNSSTACFWMKQVFFPKGGSGIGRGIQDEAWEQRYQIDSTKLATMPLPDSTPNHVATAQALDRNATQRAALAPSTVLAAWLAQPSNAVDWVDVRARRDRLLAEAVALQERLDWDIYADFGLLSESDVAELGRSACPKEITPGQRAFERLLIEREPTTSWFSRNCYSDPRGDETHISAQANVIRANKTIDLIERPEHKRRWAVPDHAAEERVAARAALADRLEREFVSETIARREIYAKLRGQLTTSFEALVDLADNAASDVLAHDGVPFLSVMNFSQSGMDKRKEWETTWQLQRREELGEKSEGAAAPPKYVKKDFRTDRVWQIRGPLDVPRERFITYPGCESDHDGEPVYGWGGWNYEQRAKALATLYWKRKTEESWGKDRLAPMLAGLLELLPWLKQWHSAVSDDYAGDSPANYYATTFLDGECSTLGLTHDDLRAWRPAAKVRGKKAATKTAAAMVSGDDVPVGDPVAKPVRKKRTKKDAVVQEGSETP